MAEERDPKLIFSERCAFSDPVDPTLPGNPIQSVAALMEKAARSVQTCLPARILSYNRVTHVATVQPLCNAVTNTGDSIERPSVNVHVIRLASGLHKIDDPTQPKGYRIVPGAMIDIPLTVGDTGWLIASDADTFLQKSTNANYLKEDDAGPSVPNTNIIHAFRHGVFIPDSFCSFPKITEFGDDIVIGTYTYNEETGEATITPFKFEIDEDRLRELLAIILPEILPDLCVTSLNTFHGDIELTEGNRIIITPSVDPDTGAKTIQISAIDQVIPTPPTPPVYTEGDGIDITNYVISNTGVLSVKTGSSTLTGNVTLKAGMNVTLSVSENEITINGTGGGDGGGGMFAWTPPANPTVSGATGTIGVGGCVVGRTYIACNSGIGSGKAINTTYSLKVTLNANAATSLEVVSGIPIGTAPSNGISYIPIYKIGTDGKIAEDYRGAFVVPVYEG